MSPSDRSSASPGSRERALAAAALALTLLLHPGCRMDSRAPGPAGTPARPIEDVIRDHTAELLAIPGVVGVYQAELDDGRPCLKVMVVKRTRALAKRIPREVEGYPVRLDETGVIRPL